jgi:hypothetical protein
VRKLLLEFGGYKMAGVNSYEDKRESSSYMKKIRELALQI